MKLPWHWRAIRWAIGLLQSEAPDEITAFGRTKWLIENPSLGLRAHAATHRKQQRRDKWKYYARYFWEWTHKPYREISYEKECYSIQSAVNSGVLVWTPEDEEQ